jgi:FkbM family methyltransferase
MKTCSAPGTDDQSELDMSPPYMVVEDDQGICFSLPPRIDCISTYVLLEQGRWFEKELDFVLRFSRPGMLALDIGANIGVYSLPLARYLGPGGRVVAYEPGGDNRKHLERSAILNGLDSLEISAKALSNFAGPGHLKIAFSGELNRLVDAPEDGEPIEVSTLDAELDRRRWERVDFVKLDAEGQEEAILEGGRRFLEKFSPLMMFEIKCSKTHNLRLINAFRAAGFGIFRLLGDATMLVPFDEGEAIDLFMVNLFAARPDQVNALAVRGLLASRQDDAELSATERSAAIAAYCAQEFALAAEVTPADVDACPFGDAIVAHSAYRFLASLAAGRRLALLQRAYEDMLAHCAKAGSAAALSTLARVAHDFGRQTVSLDALKRLRDSENKIIDQPFLLAAPRFERMAATPIATWFLYSIEESAEFSSGHSSLFERDMDSLASLSGHTHASDEVIRRLILASLLEGGSLKDIEEPLARLTNCDETAANAWRGVLRQLVVSH